MGTRERTMAVTRRSRNQGFRWFGSTEYGKRKYGSGGDYGVRNGYARWKSGKGYGYGGYKRGERA